MSKFSASVGMTSVSFILILMSMCAAVVPGALRAGRGVSAALSPGGAVLAMPGNNLTINLVRVPAGVFEMGNADSDQFGTYSQCETPRHTVRISQSFLMSKYEITVQQFRIFAQASGYQTDAERNGLGCNGLALETGRVIRSPDCIWSSPGFEQADDHPVICVSWHDADEFCRWLSVTTGRKCRLPREAEWEYCCRAGSVGLFATGDSVDSLRSSANCGDQSLAQVYSGASAVAPWQDDFAFTAPVGTFSANAFGLHDMHGNVGEWCSDWFDPNYYEHSAPVDPEGPSRATEWHVVRGGSWYNTPSSCRCSGRHDGIETAASTTNGFRIVVDEP